MPDEARTEDAVVEELLARLDTVEARLRRHAAAETPRALTDADAATGERWEAGQVWAHIAEFVPYWQQQAGIVLAAAPGEPAAFGRTATDAARIEAIERDRHQAPQALMARVAAALDDLRRFATELPAADWERTGSHPTRGEIPVRTILERFEVIHLEEHAGQLDTIAEAPGGDR